MLELLILYSLNKTELTLYGLRKHIIQNFGEISKPSHGALHPALKRLKDKNVISERKKLSDGGKLYSFYSVNNGFKEYFNDKYVEINKIKNFSLEIFLTELKTRIFVADIVDSSILDRFKEISILSFSSINKYHIVFFFNIYI